MVQTNKILTVSYGTFSCTLEGFDDSFGTMKAIAEYFRDLAADDRYFGAEPPQPDAEMLGRIAQREIARQVEVHNDNNGILLRAASPALQAATAPATAPKTEEKELVEEPEPAHPAPAPVAEEPVAEEPVAEEPAPEPVPAPEPEVAQAPVQELVPEPEAAAAEPEVALAETEVDDIEPAPQPVAAATSETMADKLARIRAVVERNDALVDDQIEDVEDAVLTTDAQDAEPEEEIETAPETVAEAVDTYAEDANAEDADEDDDISDALAEALAEAVGEADVDDDVADAAPEAFVLDDALLSPVAEDIEDPAVAEIAEDEDILAEQPAADIPDETDDLIDSVLAAAEQAHDADEDAPAKVVAGTSDGYEGEYEEDDESLFQDLLEEEDGEIDDDESLLDEPESEAITPHALKVKRADIEQAIADGGFAEVSDAPAETRPDSSLSPDDEADLQAELEAVAAELAEAQAALNPPDQDAEQTAASTRSRGARSKVFKDVAPPITRILEETEGRMDEPEAALSREAYDHLRAAVAATKAESKSGDASQKALTDEAYRDDLASVVRPRRPGAAGNSTRPRRPDEARPAPLKLVAEQRIDADTILPQRGPIRPRRVAAELEDNEEEQKTQSGFATFAQEVGAKELPELLEAAAAYMSYVEGWEQFSRPQLMTRVKQVENSGFNREDGLRTFGQLLREGKIEKTSGGRFTASERIGFRPARKAAG